ncbi:tetratricopeptide repeat protein [candidate division WOR-3 bacterium]|nr:tetratricopeptide repeat protein [candidate division WOR-3 bacterium]
MWISICFSILLLSPETVGDYFFNQGIYKRALRIYERVYYEEPSFTLKSKIGMALYAMGDWDNSKRWLKGVHSDENRSATVLGKIYFKEGKLELAREHFSQALHRQDACATERYWLGLIALEKGEYEEAKVQFKLSGDKYSLGFANYKLSNTKTAVEIFQSIKDFYALGVINYKEKEFKPAIEHFKSAGEANGVGASFYRLKNYKKALDYFKEANDDFFTAECLYKLRKFKEARKYYQKAVRKGIQPRDALWGLAWASYRSGKFDSAGREFEKFYHQTDKQESDNLKSVALYRAGRANLKIGNLKKSIQLFKDVIQEYPESQFVDDAQYWIGKTYFIQTNYTESIKELKRLLTHYPKSKFCSYAYMVIGDSYYEQSDYKSSVKWYKKIEGPLSLLDDSRFKCEECYFKLGKYISRLDILRNFIHKYPNSLRAPKLAIELAQYWFRQNNFKRASETYNTIIQDFSWWTGINEAKLKLAECYFKLGKYKASISIYQELLHSEIGAKAQFNLANTYFLMGDYKSAIHEYEILINEFSNSDFASDGQYQIGVAYERLKKSTESRIAFQEFIEKYPEDIRYWDAKLELARMYREEGSMEEAVDILLYIDKSAQGKVKGEAIMELGSLYFDKEDYKIAKEFYLKSAIQYDDKDCKSRALLFAAQCAVNLGEEEEAIKLYESIIELFPSPILLKEAKKGLKGLPTSSIGGKE